MKIVLILFFLVTLSLSLTSQPNFPGLVDSTHVWTWNEFYWIHRERNLFTYDAQGRIATILRVERYTDPWKISSLQTFSYDGDSDVINQIVQTWNGTSLQYSRQYVYTYDSNKNLIEILNQDWSIDTWIPSSRQVMEYDDQNNRIEMSEQSWDNDVWHPVYKDVMAYDDQNNLVELESYLRNGAEWIGSFRHLYAYDQDNRVIQNTSQTWDTAWINNSQQFYSYTVNGDLEITLHQSWWQDEWKTESRLLNEFSPEFRLLRSVYQKPTPNDWFDQNQTLYSYDTIGNELSQLFQTKSQDEWHNESRKTKEYDFFQNQVSEANQEWIEDKWVYTDSTFYYFPFISGTKDLIPADLAFIFPNPVRSDLYFQFDDFALDKIRLSIYSANGQHMMQTSIQDKKTFQLDVNDLASGTYFLRIFSNYKYQVIPFIRQ